MSQGMAQVAILDSQPLSRAGLAHLCQTGANLSVIYAGSDLAAVRHLVPRPSLILLDVNLGERPVSIRTARELVNRGSALVAIGAHPRDPATRRAVAAGALGYVSRLDEPEHFVAAMSAALTGQRWCSPSLMQMLGHTDAPPSLSEKEILALQLYAGGLKLDAVARRMQVAPSTAKEYIDRVRHKYAAVGRPAPTKVDLYHVGKQDGFINS